MAKKFLPNETERDFLERIHEEERGNNAQLLKWVCGYTWQNGGPNGLSHIVPIFATFRDEHASNHGGFTTMVLVDGGEHLKFHWIRVYKDAVFTHNDAIAEARRWYMLGKEKA